jgi:hypothetical protein
MASAIRTVTCWCGGLSTVIYCLSLVVDVQICTSQFNGLRLVPGGLVIAQRAPDRFPSGALTGFEERSLVVQPHAFRLPRLWLVSRTVNCGNLLMTQVPLWILVAGSVTASIVLALFGVSRRNGRGSNHRWRFRVLFVRWAAVMSGLAGAGWLFCAHCDVAWNQGTHGACGIMNGALWISSDKSVWKLERAVREALATKAPMVNVMVPSVHMRASYRSAALPLLGVAVAGGVMAAVALAVGFFDTTRTGAMCSICGYNLTGNRSGQCSECGQVIVTESFE